MHSQSIPTHKSNGLSREYTALVICFYICLMGQRIAAVITKGQVDVPESIVHFAQHNLTIIVLDFGEWDVSNMIEAALEFEQFDSFIDHLKETDFMVSDDEGDSYRMDEWVFLIELIESLELKSWFIEFYSEWGDRPSNHLFMPIIDNKIIREACCYMWNEDEMDYSLISAIKLRMGLTLNWIANEKRYFSYKHAKQDYELKIY